MKGTRTASFRSDDKSGALVPSPRMLDERHRCLSDQVNIFKSNLWKVSRNAKCAASATFAILAMANPVILQGSHDLHFQPAARTEALSRMEESRALDIGIEPNA
jgi:hypothetical protein